MMRWGINDQNNMFSINVYCFITMKGHFGIMGDPTKVYCDSEELLQDILSVHPSIEGLYPHEIAMLNYISYGTTTTQEHKWLGQWKYTFHVYQPEELFLSLVERGYIAECSDEEIFDCIKMKEMQGILKSRGIKPGNNKEIALELIRQTVTGSELANELGYRYYVLTDAGKKGLENSQSDSSYPKLKAEQITKRGKANPNNSGYDLYIDSATCKGKLYFSNTSSEVNQERVVRFDKPTSLTAYVDGEQLCSVPDINTYQILGSTGILLVGKMNGTESVDCVAYDIKKKTILISGNAGLGIYTNGSTYEMQQGINSLNQDDSDSFVGSSMLHFCAVEDALADEIINKYIAKKASVSKIPPVVPGDRTVNYRIAVDQNDNDCQFLVAYLAVYNMVNEPQIMGAPINSVLRALAYHSDNKVEEMILDNHWRCDPKVVTAMRFVQYNISRDYQTVIRELLKHYSKRALGYDPFGHYYGQKRTPGTRSYFHHEIIRSRAVYERKFKDLVASLREQGILDVRWISEFSLYKLVLSYYDDTEYQKRFDWLGQQSLDIYIPQLKTGIEYQGEQHYSPIDVFGGEESYKDTVIRDERKRKLCQDNGIRLLEWPYSLEINAKNLKKMLVL